MKPYGLTRNQNMENPDVADIHEYGRKGSMGHLPGKGGDVRSYHKNSSAKRTTRRHFKRRARAEGRCACEDWS